MYTHPAFTRRGIGRRILALCESAAAAEGSASLQLAATLAGQPLYEASGFTVVGSSTDDTGGVPVPIVHMHKLI